MRPRCIICGQSSNHKMVFDIAQLGRKVSPEVPLLGAFVSRKASGRARGRENISDEGQGSDGCSGAAGEDEACSRIGGFAAQISERDGLSQPD